jgi:hypothetical protein
MVLIRSPRNWAVLSTGMAPIRERSYPLWLPIRKAETVVTAFPVSSNRRNRRNQTTQPSSHHEYLFVYVLPKWALRVTRKATKTAAWHASTETFDASACSI